MNKRRLKMFLAICTSAVVAQAHGEDPDFKKEESFHRIYKTYNQHPTSAEAWEKVLSNRKASTYTIQKKDTLWDVSQTFFGDSNYWPKVWSYNTEGILNPHEINPKQVIRFYAGNLQEPPTVGLADLSAPEESMPTEVIEKKSDGSVEAIKIPPTTRVIHPVLKHLPDSIPLYRLGGVNRPPITFEAGAKPVIPIPQRFLSVYVTDRDVVSNGEVVETEMVDMKSASEFQYITVRLLNPSAKQLIAYSDANTVSDGKDAAKATVVAIQGEIEVLERVGELDDHTFRAMVRKTVNPVMVGAKLMPGTMQMFNVTSSSPSTSAQAKIIGGESEKYQKIFGDDEFVFLNAGASEGLQEGSTLQVFMNERVRKANTKNAVNDRVIGTVKIVKLADHFSTAFILNAETDVVIGDYVGGSVKASAAATSAPESSSSSESDGLSLDSPEVPGAADPFAEPPSSGDGTSGDGELEL